ncbi:hypothetical protein [Chamaesiphon minutus]|uniref:Uncharacterized protein n=1 Tax=Chamaesiphon minutus (strain ATCC 27169 / PCC 6605) TaxID=1173020 RepID=K9UF75_CHAP6|nr:hypothetical protein [Chamaesiphon minutus]AFY93091.1 hypothetical protein Cha6605_1986 [Chamaesiphon minutus PCC 6605]
MTQFYGYRCYDSNGTALGWFYTTNSGRACEYTNNPTDLHWAKKWRTIKGAERLFDGENSRWRVVSKGGWLKIEPMPEFKIPLTRTALKRKKWDAENPEAIRQSKAEYDRKNPVMSFRPTPELVQWLEEERWADDEKPETDAALIKRKLEKLMKMENQGY